MFRGDTWVGIWSIYVMVMVTTCYFRNQLDMANLFKEILVGVLGGYVAYGTITKAAGFWAAAKGAADDSETK